MHRLSRLFVVRIMHILKAILFLFLFIYLFIFFFLGGGTNSLILSRVNLKVGPKRGIPEKNHLITCKEELGLSHM